MFLSCQVSAAALKLLSMVSTPSSSILPPLTIENQALPTGGNSLSYSLSNDSMYSIGKCFLEAGI